MKITFEINGPSELHELKLLLDKVHIYRLPPDWMTIDELALTERTKKVLKADGLFKVNQIIGKAENELLKIPNMGRKSLAEIRSILANNGFEQAN